VTLPTDEQILITREFDAPKHLVYEAWTTPELVRRWWTAKRGEATIASTEVYEGMPDAEALNTLTLTEADGRTILTVLVQHTSKEDRDAHIDYGMEAGMQDAMDLLERVAISLR
jgi:Uncharacterized conserved protein